MGKYQHRPPAQSRGILPKGKPVSNRNGSIIQPNALNVETTFADGPLAQPCAVTLQQPGAIKVLAVGGLTKVEALAGQIASGAAIQLGEMAKEAHLPSYATVCVDLAEAILAESARRRTPAETAQ
jgi:hypothetical protein